MGMQDGGNLAENWYIHTPICCPSRAELLTGRYFHNIKQVGGKLWGMHVNETLVNGNTFARVLNEQAGYTVGMFGKYLNVMPDAVPPGFDAWLANGGGDYIAPNFLTKNIDGLPDGHWQGTAQNYSTAVIGNTSIAWIKKVGREGKPFLAYVAPKAAHEPFNPAPWYADAWDPSWPEHEPRGENWNCSFEARKNHHGNIPTEPLITADTARLITGIWRNRWRTLMSVDDVISDVFQTADELGLLDRTYFFYSSDHGFQLGQFNIPMDKRHVYEWDTKIHLLSRGPGIKPGSTFANPGTQVDIAPTILGLAGVPIPENMDGKSIVPFLVDPTDETLLESTRLHLSSLGDLDSYAQNWRQEVFIENYFVNTNIKCTKFENCTLRRNYPETDSWCADLTPGKYADCWCGSEVYPTDPEGSCYATEDTTNNFIALRNLRAGENKIYAEYQSGSLYEADVQFDAVDFVEYFDVGKDREQLHNLATKTSQTELQPLSERLHAWYKCSGKACP